MTQPNVLVFECLAFGEPHWNDAAESLRYGQALATAIAHEIGAGEGLTVEQPVLRGSYGWEFIVGHGACRIWCLLQRADSWLLITEPRRALADRQHHTSFEADHSLVCAAIDVAVQRIPGLGARRWLTLAEYHSGR